jgi:hypothetical protein
MADEGYTQAGVRTHDTRRERRSGPVRDSTYSDKDVNEQFPESLKSQARAARVVRMEGQGRIG